MKVDCMTNKEIMQNALMKAYKGGTYDFIKSFKENNINYTITDKGDVNAGLHGLCPYESIIFSHAFAKAFWGEENCIGLDKSMLPIGVPITLASQTDSGVAMWQYHLQQMVLEKEPLKYLEKFL